MKQPERLKTSGEAPPELRAMLASADAYPETSAVERARLAMVARELDAASPRRFTLRWVLASLLLGGAAVAGGVKAVDLLRAPVEVVAPAVPRPPLQQTEPQKPQEVQEEPAQDSPAPEPKINARPIARPTTPEADALLAEARLLESARALRVTAPKKALRELREYEREFPHGQLICEKELITIEVLLRLGRRDAAKHRAASFTQLDGAEVYRERLQQLLDEGAKP